MVGSKREEMVARCQLYNGVDKFCPGTWMLHVFFEGNFLHVPNH